ncbi:radical SAM family heme chaperone HemW [Veillonella caviae]|uniref:radical SAM family heme chaperone HemW n=1 Tax=Veillonella caviae TaxID=248316 RepID=UPI0023F6B209|nr:radical SAM family heme chaperone HemW [Veillonella caviae]MCI7693397.1 radical SAM family heme chaperone HemW [Veillonella caviae]MDY5253374.1 radical SAM family heme chaperone HemW [Veillonella caviae]
MNNIESSLLVQRDMGIYIHIPFCKQKCIYCDFPAYQNLQDYYDTYLYALLQEMTMFVDAHPEVCQKPVDTVYFGGGTPTELSIEQLYSILNQIKVLFNITDDCQFTIESNPGELTKAYIAELVQLGFSRISFGVQTFNDKNLVALHRSHRGQDAIQAVNWAHEVGFKDINLDLIYGLPNQVIEHIEQDLDMVSQLPINHISTYGLQVEKGTYLYHLVHRNLITLPSEHVEDALYETMMMGIEALGFERYEISNFAKDRAYSKHNLKYWQYSDYLGFGAGAHSFYDGVRRANNRNVMPYARTIDNFILPIIEEEIIDESRAIEDYCFLALRTKWGIQEQSFYKKFGIAIQSKYNDVLMNLIDKQLLVYRDNAFIMTPEGIKHGNYVFSQFIDM